MPRNMQADDKVKRMAKKKAAKKKKATKKKATKSKKGCSCC